MSRRDFVAKRCFVTSMVWYGMIASFMSEERTQHIQQFCIESLDQLRVMANRDDPLDIAIRYGPVDVAGKPSVFVASKLIQYRRNRNGRHWWVCSMIDGSEFYYTEPQLRRNTNILEAVAKGALYAEIDMAAWQ